jgi:hypothetical protein
MRSEYDMQVGRTVGEGSVATRGKAVRCQPSLGVSISQRVLTDTLPASLARHDSKSFRVVMQRTSDVREERQRDPFRAKSRTFGSALRCAETKAAMLYAEIDRLCDVFARS